MRVLRSLCALAVVLLHGWLLYQAIRHGDSSWPAHAQHFVNAVRQLADTVQRRKR